MVDADLLRAMSQAEDALAKRIAERAIGCGDEAEKRFLRGLWQFSNARAGHLMEMAHDAGPVKTRSNSQTSGNPPFLT